MQREIGSNFWIGPNDISTTDQILTQEDIGLSGSDYAFTSSGRGALRMVLQTIFAQNPSIPRRVMLPPFTCHTVIEPFLEVGCEVSHYTIGTDFCTTGEQLQKDIQQYAPGILLIHRYFGFDTLNQCEAAIESIRKNGTIIIEDCTQSIYSHFPPLNADFWVGSLRKWAALPDGGYAVSAKGVLADHPDQYDKALEHAKLQACYAKYYYMTENRGSKVDFLPQYRMAEEMLSEEKLIYAISPAACAVQQSLNFTEIGNIRRENCKILLKGLRERSCVAAIFSTIPENVTPLYFPIMVQGDRTKLQQFAAQNEIYLPIVWPRAECLSTICTQAEELYAQSICVPIDQRYDTEDMKRILSMLQDYEISRDC